MENVNNSLNVTDNTNNQSNTPNSTFASMASKNSEPKYYFPERTQGILFPAIDGISLFEYIVGVGSLIGPKNVTFASRVSGGRICIFLASKVIVDNFIKEIKGIKVKEEFIEARRLVTPATRIILSNVSPVITNEILVEELKRLNLKPVSPITLVSVGSPDPNYKHVQSFRRQVYVDLEEGGEIPSSTLISCKENVFRIFLSKDELTCFLCKLKGHKASKCPSNEANSDKHIEKMVVP